MRKISNILLLLTVIVLTGSCINDNFDDCNNVTIYFEYKADGDTDVLSKYISKMDLYVFDENGQLRGVGTYGKDELSKNTTPSFRLSPGKFRVVAVGNMYDKTEVVNLTEHDFENIFIQHPSWGTSDRVNGHDDNYLGQKYIEVTGYETHTREVVELKSSHIDVDIELVGFPVPANNGEIPYELRIEQSNAQTNFNNNINDHEKGTCYPDLTYDAESGKYHTTHLRLFRMDHNGHLKQECCEHILVVTDKASGREIVHGSIYNYLQRHEEEIDVTKQEAYLPIAIEYRGQLEAEITIPDWVIVDGEPEWQ